MEKRRIAESNGQTECFLQKQAAALLLQGVNDDIPALHCYSQDSKTFFFFSFLLEDFDSISAGLELCMDFIV